MDNDLRLLADVLEAYANLVLAHLAAPGDASALVLEDESKTVIRIAQEARTDWHPGQ